MKVRLGTTDIGLGRYLALWTAIVVLFAVQNNLHATLGGPEFDTVDYLRWSMIQWYTWAALGPLVFRLAARYPIRGEVR